MILQELPWQAQAKNMQGKGHDTKFWGLLLFVNQQFSICGIELGARMSTSYRVAMLTPKDFAFTREFFASQH